MESEVANIWDIDNSTSLSIEEKYNSVINLYDDKELNSILPSLPEFEQYYKNDIRYMTNNLPQKYILITFNFDLNDTHRLPLLYSILLFIYRKNNKAIYIKLISEVGRYLDTINYKDLPMIMLLMIRAKNVLYKYFVQKYLYNKIQLDDIKTIINNIDDDNDNVYKIFRSIYRIIIRQLLIKDEDITSVVNDLFWLGEYKLLERKYESGVIYELSKYATYEQLNRYMSEGLINLLDNDIMGSMIAINSYEDKNNYSEGIYKKLYNRFHYILNYYLDTGFSYQDILESMTIKSGNIQFLIWDKLDVVIYLLNTGKVNFLKVYSESSNEVKSKLDFIILDQI